MRLKKWEADELSKSAAYVMKQAYEMALMYGYVDMPMKGKTYAVYKICREIYETIPTSYCEVDCYDMMKYNSLRLILGSMCNDKEQYYAEVLNACKDSDEMWVAFDKMKYILDNFETELFVAWEDL